MKCEYRKNIINIIDKQINKGFSEYGKTLEQNTELTMEDRLDMASEELVDALFYIQHIKSKLKENNND